MRNGIYNNGFVSCETKHKVFDTNDDGINGEKFTKYEELEKYL